jgi:hypothetical protein
MMFTTSIVSVFPFLIFCLLGLATSLLHLSCTGVCKLRPNNHTLFRVKSCYPSCDLTQLCDPRVSLWWWLYHCRASETRNLVCWLASLRSGQHRAALRISSWTTIFLLLGKVGTGSETFKNRQIKVQQHSHWDCDSSASPVSSFCFCCFCLAAHGLLGTVTPSITAVLP